MNVAGIRSEKYLRVSDTSAPLRVASCRLCISSTLPTAGSLDTGSGLKQLIVYMSGTVARVVGCRTSGWLCDGSSTILVDEPCGGCGGRSLDEAVGDDGADRHWPLGVAARRGRGRVSRTQSAVDALGPWAGASKVLAESGRCP